MHKKFSEISQAEGWDFWTPCSYFVNAFMKCTNYWITLLFTCGKKVAVRASEVSSAPFPITMGFTPHWKKWPEIGESNMDRAGNCAPTRSMAWSWNKLPRVTATSHKSSLRISRTTDSEQTSSEHIKKQCQLVKYNQNSTERCDTVRETGSLPNAYVWKLFQ